jgi:hypothetical protein
MQRHFAFLIFDHGNASRILFVLCCSDALNPHPLSGHSCSTQLRTAKSPICEFDFFAARARSTGNAAIAKSFAPPRGEKTGHSCKPQQDKSVEFTDCRQNRP